jgi:hypothetical protein
MMTVREINVGELNDGVLPLRMAAESCDRLGTVGIAVELPLEMALDLLSQLAKRLGEVAARRDEDVGRESVSHAVAAARRRSV